MNPAEYLEKDIPLNEAVRACQDILAKKEKERMEDMESLAEAWRENVDEGRINREWDARHKEDKDVQESGQD